MFNIACAKITKEDVRMNGIEVDLDEARESEQNECLY